jgi:hypothetical protein
MSNSDFWLLIAGALLAVIGGILGDYLKMLIDNSRERKHIKILLQDELSIIESVISRFNETYKKSGNANKSYLKELLANMDSYNNQRSRLFLFKEAKMRKDISSFYFDLNQHIQDSDIDLGTLLITDEAKRKQDRLIDDFVKLSVRANALSTKLK